MPKFKLFTILFKIVCVFAVVLLVSCGDDEEMTPTPQNQAPIALFTANPLVATVGDVITFSDQSGDSDGNIASWAWDFGDGNSSSDQNPSHTYGSGNVYTVNLTVTDDDGATSQATQEITINAFEVLWSFNAGFNISPSSPAIADDGSIYFGTQGNELIALNRDGTVKWRFMAADRVRSAPAIGSDGTVYVGSLDDNFYAVDGNSGVQKWAFTTGANIFLTSAAIASDGTIFIGSDDNSFYALNPDGSLLWSYDTASRVRGLPSISANGNTVYVGNAEGKVFAFNTSSGELNWIFQTGGKIEGQCPIADDGTMYAGSDDAKLYAINPDGTQKWAFPTADGNPITGGPAIGTDGSLYFGTKDGGNGTSALIYSVSSSGAENWRFETGAGTSELSALNLSTPTIGADGTIYAPSFNGNVYAFNTDGTLKFTFESDDPDPTNAFDQAIWSSVALDDNGVIYFGDYSGDFRAVQVSNTGLANSAWPTQGKNLKRTGR